MGPSKRNITRFKTPPPNRANVCNRIQERPNFRKRNSNDLAHIWHRRHKTNPTNDNIGETKTTNPSYDEIEETKPKGIREMAKSLKQKKRNSGHHGIERTKKKGIREMTESRKRKKKYFDKFPNQGNEKKSTSTNSQIEETKKKRKKSTFKRI